MNLRMNCKNLVRQLLPPHKRQPVRLSLLAGFRCCIAELFRSVRYMAGQCPDDGERKFTGKSP